MSGRWVDEERRARLDLRLALPAVAVWLGCIVALRAPAVTWWLAAVLGVALGGSVWSVRVAVRRGGFLNIRRGRAVIAGLICFVGCGGFAMATTALTVTAAASDPLMIAASKADWVVADVTLGYDPTPVRSGFVAPEESDAAESDTGVPGAAESDTGAPGAAESDAAVPVAAETGAAGSGDAASRWRLTGRAVLVSVDGVAAPSSAAVTVFGTGSNWGNLRAHQTVRVRGIAAVDPFEAMPSATVRARGDPDRVRAAPWWYGWATTARNALTRAADTLEQERGGLLRGLVVGDTAGIGEELDADAKTVGLTHLVAVSGSHVAIVAGLVLLLLRRFGPRVSSAAVAMTFILLVLLVGPSPSVLRSVTMGMIGVVAAVVGRTRAGLAALAAAVFMLLLLDPALAVSVGFSLSVLATAGLILLAPVLVRALQRRRVPTGWAMLLALPIAAHLTTMPVIAAIGGNVSLAAVPANIAVTPVVTPALLIGLGCLAVGPWWSAGAELLAQAAGPLLGWVISVAHRLARLPWASIPWSESAWGVIALIGAIAVGLVLFRYRRSRLALLAAVAGVLAVLVSAHVASVGWPGDGWLVTMCDVGQGDGIVLATDTPGVVVVVDTGPAGSDMAGCLDRLGAHEIALLVITHLHADHVGGLADVADGRVVDAIAIGPDRSAPSALATIGQLAGQRGVPVATVTPGARWSAAGLTLTVLGPRRAFHGTESDPNNDSVVLIAERHGVRTLLTGDIELPAQQSLVDAGADLRADILKQPHHGSAKLSPAFLAAVSPTVALIGVGAGNDYGHPSETALRLDRSAGVLAVARTDLDGDVQIVLTPAGLATLHRGRSLGAAPA